MMIIQFIVFGLESVLGGFLLWLGLYILAHERPTHKNFLTTIYKPAIFAGMAMILISWFMFGVAMQTVSTTVADYILWQRVTWWTVPIGCLFYLGSIGCLLFPTWQQKLWQPSNLGWGLLLLMITLVVTTGTATNLFLYYDQIEANHAAFQTFHIPFKLPHYYLYALFIGGILGICSTLLIRRFAQARNHSSQENERWKWLGVGSIIVAVGGILSIVGFGLLNNMLPEQLGDSVIAVGVAVIGYGIAKYNALEQQTDVSRHFRHSLTRAVLTAILYIAIFVSVTTLFAYSVSFVTFPLLIYLAVLSSTTTNWALADRLLLPEWAVVYRDQLTQLQQEVLLEPEATQALNRAESSIHQIVSDARRAETDAMIHQEIETIFQYSRFMDDEVLASSRLHELACVQKVVAQSDQALPITQTPSPAQLARRLRSFLIHVITTQFPSPALNPSASLSSDEISYLLLQKKYIEDLPRKMVEKVLAKDYGIELPGGTYTRCLKQARHRLSEIVCNYEEKIQKT